MELVLGIDFGVKIELVLGLWCLLALVISHALDLLCEFFFFFFFGTGELSKAGSGMY